jgi:hypothetical protein
VRLVWSTAAKLRLPLSLHHFQGPAQTMTRSRFEWHTLLSRFGLACRFGPAIENTTPQAKQIALLPHSYTSVALATPSAFRVLRTKNSVFRDNASGSKLLTLVSCLDYYSTLKTEATCSSETSVDFQRNTSLKKIRKAIPGPPLWSSGQSSLIQIQRSRVRFPALPDFLRSSGSGTGSTQPRECKWGATWRK